MQRPVVVPRSLLPSVTTRRTLMGLIGSDTRLLIVMWSKLPAERPVSRMSRPVVLLSLVRAPAQPPQHAYFGSQPHTPSSPGQSHMALVVEDGGCWGRRGWTLNADSALRPCHGRIRRLLCRGR